MVQHTLILCVLFICATGVTPLKVSISSDGPAVRGSNITFTATVQGYGDSTETLEYYFWDTAQPEHSDDFYLASNTSTWTVQYDRNLYEAGEYRAKVNLKRSYLGLYIVVSSAETTFKLTDSLNGDLILSQNNKERPNNFVAVNKTVNHYVRLPDNELQFLQSNSSSIITYWFIDCAFIDMTKDFSLNYTYNDVMKDHYLDALVVANHEPLPPLPTPTTPSTTPSTTTPKTTSSTTTTTTTTTSTTPTSSTTTTTITTTTTTTTKSTKPAQPITTPMTAAPSTGSPKEKGSSSTHKVARRSIPNKNAINRKARSLSNKTGIKRKTSPLTDFICNHSIVPIGESYTYGHYQETLSVREPIATPVNITGKNWLQHAQLMNLQVQYTGSPPFQYCSVYKVGEYNITGNETCSRNKIKTVSKNFTLVHYFADTDHDQHTVVVIIENDVGKSISRAIINIYKVSVHSQLSVIVVPVVFGLLAVILVVFGIAYYQHRSRHNIEVADFDFGQQSHLDYKTFMERLRDSFRNAFKFGHDDDTDPLTANTRYDSMT